MAVVIHTYMPTYVHIYKYISCQLDMAALCDGWQCGGRHCEIRWNSIEPVSPAWVESNLTNEQRKWVTAHYREKKCVVVIVIRQRHSTSDQSTFFPVEKYTPKKSKKLSSYENNRVSLRIDYSNNSLLRRIMIKNIPFEAYQSMYVCRYIHSM
jgi:hypothetical protein